MIYTVHILVVSQMRKVRNLTELIVEAESVLSDPLNNTKVGTRDGTIPL